MLESVKNAVGIGYRFGRMTVIEKTPEKKNGFPVWRCHCDCGNELLMDTRWIRRGTKLDCGCVTKISPVIRDLTGCRFGKLVVLSPTERRAQNGSVIWHCVCDCGNEVDVPGGQLTNGYKELRLSEPSAKEGLYRKTLWTADRHRLCGKAGGAASLALPLRLRK